MGEADGHDEQRGDGDAERRALGAMIGAGALAVEDVQRPAHASPQREGGADRIDTGTQRPERQQQPEAEHRESDPEEVDRAPRGEQRHGQRPGELQRHADAQRNRAQGHVEHQVHPAEGDPVDDQRLPRPGFDALAPRTQDRQQDHRGEQQAHGRGALRADGRKDTFGQRSATLDRDHGDQQECNGIQQRSEWGAGHGKRPGRLKQAAKIGLL
ncbi:hypothetical protein D9M71_406510 [compost metagenome]